MTRHPPTKRITDSSDDQISARDSCVAPNRPPASLSLSRGCAQSRLVEFALNSKYTREREREGVASCRAAYYCKYKPSVAFPAELYAKTATKLRIKAGFEVDFEEEEDRLKYTKWWNFNFFFDPKFF